MIVKQKGGEFEEFHIPGKLEQYFECVMKLFTKINRAVVGVSFVRMRIATSS